VLCGIASIISTLDGEGWIDTVYTVHAITTLGGAALELYCAFRGRALP
jgi:hypothetical protein